PGHPTQAPPRPLSRGASALTSPPGLVSHCPASSIWTGRRLATTTSRRSGFPMRGLYPASREPNSRGSADRGAREPAEHGGGEPPDDRDRDVDGERPVPPLAGHGHPLPGEGGEGREATQEAHGERDYQFLRDDPAFPQGEDETDEERSGQVDGER